MDKKDHHVIEAMGKSKVLIENEKVVEVGKPLIDYCPLFDKYRGIEKIDEKSIKENMEFRIKDFGMCSPSRKIAMKDFLSFGISEILSTLLDEKIIDSVVMVCEGCGTTIITESDKVQGIGGRVSGLVETSPIPELIGKIGKDNILDSENAIIDQLKGIELAISKGYENIAVTIATIEDLKAIREIEKNNENIKIYIFAVHTTGVTEKEAKKLFDYCDVITSCASKPIRDIGEKIAILKVGEAIPIYASTESGKMFLNKRIKKIGGIKPKTNVKYPKPLI